MEVVAPCGESMDAFEPDERLTEQNREKEEWKEKE